MGPRLLREGVPGVPGSANVGLAPIVMRPATTTIGKMRRFICTPFTSQARPSVILLRLTDN